MRYSDFGMWATLYTDASYSRRHGGAWAVWLVSRQGRIVRAGKCPRYVKSSNDAELAAIFAGLWLAIQAWGGDGPDTLEGVTIHADCQGALSLVDAGDARPKKGPAQRLHAKVHDLIAHHDLSLETRWVRAHQKAADAGTAGYLNNRCDSLAKRARTELV